jgi:hypothetical protein
MFRSYDLDIYDRNDRIKPKIISTFQIADLSDPRIRDHYEKTDADPSLLIRKQ